MANISIAKNQQGNTWPILEWFEINKVRMVQICFGGIERSLLHKNAQNNNLYVLHF